MADLNKLRIKNISLGELRLRAKTGALSPEDLESIEHVKETLSNVVKSFNEQFKATVRNFTSKLTPLFEDIDRAKNLVSIASDEDYPVEVMDALQANIDCYGELTPRQILFLILEAKGIDTAKMAATLGSKGGENKKGYKSDISKALEEVVSITGDASYQAVRRFLIKEVDSSILRSIFISSCDLPSKTSGGGKLRYKDSKGRDKEIGCGGVEGHLKKIRKY